jgi:hypothetical protein
MGFVRGPCWLGFACGGRRLHFAEEDEEEQGETKKVGGREREREREENETKKKRKEQGCLSLDSACGICIRRLEPQCSVVLLLPLLLLTFLFFVLLLSFLDCSCQRDLWRKNDDDEAVEKNACRRRR